MARRPALPVPLVLSLALLAGCGAARDSAGTPRLLPLDDLVAEPAPAATQSAADALAARGADLRSRAAP